VLCGPMMYTQHGNCCSSGGVSLKDMVGEVFRSVREIINPMRPDAAGVRGPIRGSGNTARAE
jgi:hypothetical protein